MNVRKSNHFDLLNIKHFSKLQPAKRKNTLMNYLLFIYIPIVISIVWSVVKNYKTGTKSDTLLIALCGAIVVINGIIKHFIFEGYKPDNELMLMQQFMECMIVPFTYLYFCMQVNRPLMNDTSFILFALALLLFMPNMAVVTDPSQTNAIATIGYKTFSIIGKHNHTYNICDIIISLQAVVTLIRIIPLFHKLGKYGLTPSKDVKCFTLWWVVTAAFAVFASINGEYDKTNEFINITCHLIFMVIITTGFWMIGRGLNLQPIVKNVSDDSVVNHSKDMASKLMVLIHTNHIHLQNKYIVDNAITDIGTNRDYFFKMLKKEFGCTFSELMNKERIKEAKRLIMTTDYSISTISQMCGFNNSSYMIKVFKQMEGVTPREWKERYDATIVN